MKKIWVVDTETTGTDPTVDKLVEVAGVLLHGTERMTTFESLVDPGIEVPPAASAVHHLTSKHLVGAPTAEFAIAPLSEPVDYFVAHNARFDASFLPSVPGPWLCTYKLALRTFPDAPSYSNQVLRYYLGLPDPVSATHAHRALYDAEVTASLFTYILDRATTLDPWDRMLEISSNPALLRKVGFGEHMGKQWSEVPKGYLSWMLKKSEGWDEDKLHTAKYWYDKK